MLAAWRRGTGRLCAGFLLARTASIFFGLLSLAGLYDPLRLLVKTEALGSTDGFHVLPSTLFDCAPPTPGLRYTCSRWRC